jgi:hypothetical protein
VRCHDDGSERKPSVYAVLGVVVCELCAVTAAPNRDLGEHARKLMIRGPADVIAGVPDAALIGRTRATLTPRKIDADGGARLGPMGFRFRRLATLPILLVALTLVACASAPPLGTPSQRPEVTIAGVTRKQALDVIAEAMLAKGMQVKRVDEYSAVFTKRDESLLGAVPFGSRYDPQPEMRITFNNVDTPAGLRVFATAAMVRNPGSAFEAVSDVTNGNIAQEMQGALERLKWQLQAGSPLSVTPTATPSRRNEVGNPPGPRGESKYMLSAEQYAKANGCQAPAAAMSLASPGSETFAVNCAGGGPMMIRCDYGTCRALK